MRPQWVVLMVTCSTFLGRKQLFFTSDGDPYVCKHARMHTHKCSYNCIQLHTNTCVHKRKYACITPCNMYMQIDMPCELSGDAAYSLVPLALWVTALLVQPHSLRFVAFRRGQESAPASSKDLPAPMLFAASFGSCFAPGPRFGIPRGLRSDRCCLVVHDGSDG